MTFGVFSTQSATYFVDYAEGSDAADGLTAATAWKHSPGDAQAQGGPASVALAPGDRVLFKGGVEYRGEITISRSGSEGKPIIFDGNTQNTFGEGRAVFDGAVVPTDWQRVSSPDQVGKNPLWKNIRLVDVSIDLSSNFQAGEFVLHRNTNPKLQVPWQRLFLIEGHERLLPLAQEPKPKDSFFPDVPEGFFVSETPLKDTYPHRVFYEEGSKGNRTLPLIGITFEGAAPVIEPLRGGAFSFEFNALHKLTEVGVQLFRPRPGSEEPQPQEVTILADNNEIITVKLDRTKQGLQKFALPREVETSKITFRLNHSDPAVRNWVKLDRVAAFNADGDNILAHDMATLLRDEKRLIQKDAGHHDDSFIGVHGGNNHVYFSRVTTFDPEKNTLTLPYFAQRIYEQTRYAFFNSPRLLSEPGEWCLQDLGGGKTRIFLLVDEALEKKLGDIGYPALRSAFQISGAISHIEIRGFLVMRYAGGEGGIVIGANRQGGADHITISDCHVRVVSGVAGINVSHASNIVVENSRVELCPGWTVGMYMNRTNHFRISECHVEKNSGSGIRHYEAKKGLLHDNAILHHVGMHSSALNFYEGCADIVFARNRVQNAIAINRSAENLLFENNVIDGMGVDNVGIAIWVTGRVGGQHARNLRFLNNTIVNQSTTAEWGGAIFGQERGSPSPIEGLVIENNILAGLAEELPGTIRNNLYIRPVEERFLGPGCAVVEDVNAIFVDYAGGDFRLRPGSPAIGAGIPDGVKDDITGNPRPQGRMDVGAYAFREE